MCLITEQKKPKIATKDIVCYKVVWKSDKKGYVESSIQGYKYRLEKLYKTKIRHSVCARVADDGAYKVYARYLNCGTITDDHYIALGEGFHSFRSIRRIKENNDNCGNIVRCIIPAGSEVYKDATGLLCSNQIIIKEIVD